MSTTWRYGKPRIAFISGGGSGLGLQIGIFTSDLNKTRNLCSINQMLS